MSLDRAGSNEDKTSGVLIIGGDFQSLGIMRGLAKAGIPFILLEIEIGIARFSRLGTQKLRKLDLLTSDDSVEFLLSLADKGGLNGWSIACVNDETVQFLAQHHEQLSTKYRLPLSPWSVTQLFYNKDKSYELAQAHGISTPTIYPSGDLEELLRCDIEYPIILKPTFKKNYYSKTKKKAILVEDEAALRREYNAMLSLIPASQIVVQEFIPGGTKNLFSYAAIFDGKEVVVGLAAHRARQHPMDFGHATTFATCVDHDEIRALATRFLQALDYRGVAEVEFMYDEKSGHYKFIEMNGRFWGWHALAFAAGLNFPRDLHLMLTDQSVEQQQPVHNTHWIRLITDGPTVVREALSGRFMWAALRDWCRFGSRMTYAVWSARDPMPFLMEVLMAPYLWWKKGF